MGLLVTTRLVAPSDLGVKEQVPAFPGEIEDTTECDQH